MAEQGMGTARYGLGAEAGMTEAWVWQEDMYGRGVGMGGPFWISLLCMLHALMRAQSVHGNTTLTVL